MRIFLLLFFSLPLFADLEHIPYDPYASLHQSINIATGCYQESHTDLIVQGAEPIIIPRTHHSGGNNPHFGTFDFPYEYIVTTVTSRNRGNRIVLRTTSGMTTEFNLAGRVGFGHHSAKEWSAICLGSPSYTHSGSGKTDLMNWRLYFHRAKGYYFELICGDGERRYYTHCGTKRGYLLAELALSERDIVEEFCLVKVVRPNGNRVHYDYDKKRRLTRVYTTDSTEATTLAWAEFSYRGDSWDTVQIRTSDQQDIRYTYEKCYGELGRNKEEYLLTSVTLNGEQVASYTYDHHRIVKRAGPLKDYRAIHYILNDRHSIKKRKHNLLRVQSLSAPVGSDGADQTVATFDYHNSYKGYGWTDATDANGNLTRYHFTPYPEHHLNLVEHFDKEAPIYSEVFTWRNCYQTGHYLITPEGVTLSARTCEYDALGNVIKETLWGDFTGTQAGHLKVEPVYSQGVCSGKNPKAKITPIGNPEKIVTTYTYSTDGFNNLLSEVCEEKRIVYTYFPNTDLVKTKKTYVDDFFQEEESFAYNSCGQLTLHTRSDTYRTRTEEILYENGLPTTLINPLKTIQRTYSKRLLPIEEILSSGELTYAQTTTYDSAGRPLIQTDFLGQQTSTTYDKAGHPIAHTTPTTTTAIRYSDSGLPIEKTQSDGALTLITQTTYDFASNPVIETDPNGGSTRTTYNFRHQPVAKTDPLGSTTTYAYDPLGRCTATTDPMGFTTHTSYNARGDPTYILYPDGSEERFTYSLYGHLLSHTDPTRLTTIYTRDYRGRPLTVTTLDKQTNYTYEGDLLASTTYPDGTSLSYAYNELGQLTSEAYEGALTTYRYDPLGRRCEVTDIATTTTTYDALDRPIHQEGPAQNISTTYDYDGNVTSQTTPYGQTYTTYGLLGPTTHTDACGGVTQITYSLSPFVITEADPLGHTTCTLHNLCGRPTLIEQSSRITAYIYDPCGRPLTESHNGYTLAYTYDSMGRPLTLTENDTRTTRYAYLEGRLISTTKPSGISLTQMYDRYGRLHIHSGPDFCDTYTYDLMDRILKVSSSEGVTTRSYDIRGHLTSETLSTGYTLYYHPDLYGRVERVTLPDASSIHYTYKGSQIASLTRGDYTFHYTYDLLGRLIHTESPIQSSDTTYDPCGRPLTLTAPSFSQALTYDPLGNLTALKTTDPRGSYAHNYTYDSLSQLASEDGVLCIHDPLGNSQPTDEYNQLLSCSYDENGNPSDYAYDSRGRLVSAYGQTYIYDPFHRRLSKNNLNYLYMGDNLIGAISHDILVELRPLGPGLGAEIGAAPLFELDQETYFPLYDHRGSTVVLLSSWNYLKEVYRYDAFGNVSICGAWGLLHATSFNPYQFLSKYADETGFIYFGRRYYSPSEGRWLTPDPAGHVDGPNLYTYCSNNPLTLLDLYGLHIGEKKCWGRVLELSTHHVIFWNGSARAWGITTGRRMQGLETAQSHIWELPKPGETDDYRDPTRIVRLSSSGICNNYQDALRFATSISNHTGETCYFCSNPSHGFLADIIGAGLNLLKVHTPEVAGQKLILNKVDQLYGSKFMIEYHAHSRGALVADLALSSVSKEITDRTCVVTYGSPKEIVRGRASEVINVRSINDGVGGINDIVWFLTGQWDLRVRADREYLLPSSYIPFADHGIMHDCYQNRLAEIVQKNNLKWEE